MKKEFTADMVDEYANKLLIGLSKEENNMVLEEFSKIDRNIASIEQIPGIEKAEPMSWCLDRCVENLREDVPCESIPLDKAFQNCDRTTDREIEIARVVA